MDIFPQKQKKWWQFASSDKMSNREQIEIFILIVLIAAFAITVYHTQILQMKLLEEKIDRINEQTKIQSEIIQTMQMIRELEIKLKSH